MKSGEKISESIPKSEKSNGVKMRNLWSQIIMNLIHGFGFSAFNVVLQPFIYEFTGESLFYTGIIISISNIMQFLPMPLIGKLSDKYGIKTIWLFGPPIFAFGLTILVFSNSIPILIVGVLIYVLGAMVNSLNFQIFVSENSGGSKKGIMYGLIFFAYFGGAIGGTYFVMLNLVLNSRVYFMIFSIILIIEWFILIFIIRTPNSSNVTSVREDAKPIDFNQKKSTRLFQNPKIKVATFFFAFDVFVWGIVLSVYNAGLKANYNFLDSNIAFIALWFQISNMVSQIPAGRIADKIGRKKCLIISQFFGMVFFSMNILASILWSQGITIFLFPGLIIGQIFFGIAVTTFIPSEQMTLTNLDDNRKALSYGIVTFIRGIGMLPTGAIGGFLAENINYTAPFVVGLVGLVIEVWFLAKYFKD
ncbi:MAG: MFS transporter [Candidatus Lokiarchaeota archaeon]|nr:MFS transporter [Candidatus Lokiarchaeota archaeon]